MSLGSTQPSKPNKNPQEEQDQTRENVVNRTARSTSPQEARQSGSGNSSFWKGSWINLVIALVLLFGGLLVVISASGWFGYRAGQRTQFANATLTMEGYIADQFTLAVDEYGQGNYALAMERLEYIRSIRTDLRAVNQLYDDISAVLNVTPTPIIPTSTPTPSPTPDLRPAGEMYDSVLQLISLGEWSTALDTLNNLRKSNPSYNIVEVDGLIYLCLRNRGVEKINTGDLEGGIYDFTLAEQFGPLDGETESYRTWARMYLLGNAFWGAYPEQAAYYYGQLVSAAPSLTDASGVSAFYRYWASLVQIAEFSATAGNWCDADQQMQVALNTWNQASVYPTATYIAEECYKILYTPTPTITNTPTITPTGWAETLFPSPTATIGAGTPTPSKVVPTNTYTLTPVPPTGTPTPTSAVPTNTPTPTPDVPTLTPTSSDTTPGG